MKNNKGFFDIIIMFFLIFFAYLGFKQFMARDLTVDDVSAFNSFTRDKCNMLLNEVKTIIDNGSSVSPDYLDYLQRKCNYSDEGFINMMNKIRVQIKEVTN
jgi:hypothetical protein